MSLRATVRDMVREGAAISVITYGEGLEGVLGSRERLLAEQKWEDFLAPLDVIEVTLGIADVWARIRRDLRVRGLTVSDNDLIIAATAMRLGMFAVSFDVKGMGHIRGLDLLVPE